MDIVGCFVWYEGKFIVLHRRPDKSQGNTYGLVAGKMYHNEDHNDAMLREIFEEIGYKAQNNELKFLGLRTWNFPEKTVNFYTYRLNLNEIFEPILNPEEHDGYLWLTPKECYARSDLTHGFHDLLKFLKLI